MRVLVGRRKPGQLAAILPHVAPVAAVAVVVVWSFRDGGYPSTSWYPGGLALAGLLVVQLVGGFVDVGRTLPTAAAASLVAFAGFQLASIVWASSKGAAWDSANRTFVYGFVFLLFAGWRSSEGARTLVALLLIAALAAVGVITLFSAARDPGNAFIFGRLASPTGYPNATAALFLIPFWPAVALAADRTRGVALRAAALGCAATLAAVAFVPQSRGAVYAFPVVALVLLALVRDRFRTTIAILVAIAPAALFVHTLSRPYDATTAALRADATRDAAFVALAAGIATALVGAALALADRRFEFVLPPWFRYVRILAAVSVAVAAVVLVASHDPRRVAHRAWTSFKADTARGGVGGTRLLGNLGSSRYDFWRVSLDLAREHPLGGVGAANFGEAYLVRRRSEAEPQYPHSLEMSVLSETGAIGACLFVSFVGLAGAAAIRARRRAAPSAALVAGSATAFTYWLAHGSVDWLWEFPALGGVALVFLGLALSHRRARAGSKAPAVVAAAIAGAVAVSFVAPWISAHQTDRASSVWQSDPALAYTLLDQAAGLDPLSDSPDVTAMTIAAELGDLRRMQASAEAAIARDRHNWYSQIQLAVALAHERRWAAAARAAAAASRLNPAEPLIGTVASAIQARRPLRLDTVNRAVLGRVETLDPRVRPSRKVG